jgi:allantoicase
MQNENEDTRFSSQWVNLAEERLGAQVLSTTDDFFAEKENLIKPGRGIFIPDKYTDHGKWMDGWESRRKRTPGNDHCVLKLGLPGKIRGVDIDTNHFLGNHPPQASVEATNSEKDPDESTQWTEILSKSPLQPGSQNLFEIQSDEVFTHVRLQIYPDGGVARFRVFGDVQVNWESIAKDELLDLASVINGGRVLSCNDMFFSSKDNLIAPGRGVNMGDGWETKRRREPGNDWVIVALGGRGIMQRLTVDTAHFKGNFPDSCSIEAANLEIAQVDDLENVEWQPLLKQTKLQADFQHEFDQLEQIGPVTHVRMQIYPDGGVSRLRCWGTLA